MRFMDPLLVKPPRTFWPHAILAWFVIFGAALAAWITFALRQRVELVSPDYYEEEVRFQTQLDRLNRTAGLRSEVAIQYDAASSQVTLHLPAGQVARHPRGRVRFYRPSEASLDFEVTLSVDAAGLQRIDVSGRRAGQWKMRLQWKADGQDYFLEETLVFAEPERGVNPAASPVGHLR